MSREEIKKDLDALGDMLLEALREEIKDDPLSILMLHLRANDPEKADVLKGLAVEAAIGHRAAMGAIMMIEAAFKAGVIRGRVDAARLAEKSEVASRE
jgi:hypothetical protein